MVRKKNPGYVKMDDDYMVWILLLVIIIILVVGIIVISWAANQVLSPITNISNNIANIQLDINRFVTELGDINIEFDRLGDLITRRFNDGIPAFLVPSPDNNDISPLSLLNNINTATDNNANSDQSDLTRLLNG